MIRAALQLDRHSLALVIRRYRETLPGEERSQAVADLRDANEVIGVAGDIITKGSPPSDSASLINRDHSRPPEPLPRCTGTPGYPCLRTRGGWSVNPTQSFDPHPCAT